MQIFLRLDFETAEAQRVGAILASNIRRTDSVNANGGALFVNCESGDAAGLRAKLERIFRENNISVMMSVGFVPASSQFDGFRPPELAMGFAM